MNNIITDKKQLLEYKDKYVVYSLNFPNGKKYIGYSSNIIRRWYSKSEYRYQRLVYRAIEKYGWNNIEKEILYVFDNSKDALQKEAELIEELDLLNPEKGYNVVPGGGDPPHGKDQYMSEETKERLKQLRSENSKKMWQNPEKAAEVIQRMKETFHESRMAMTPQQRKESFGKHNIGNIPPNAKPIYQLDKDTNEVIAEYHSAGFAALSLGLDRSASSNIRRVANGTGHIAYGYSWRWKNE